jgi:lysyl endopeptidase
MPASCTENTLFENAHRRVIISLFQTFLLCLLVSFNVSGQLESQTGSVLHKKIDNWYEIKIDSQVLCTLYSLKQPKDAAYQFALPVPVDLNPGNSGIIYQIADEKVWVIGIRSKNAKSLGLILQPFKIPEGGYVYIYDRSGKIIRGAFTSENNYSSEILPIMPVPGEELILEYHYPYNETWQNTIGITQVSHDFLGIFEIEGSKDGRYGLSQSCNRDINCPEGLPYSVQKGAVCRLIIRGIELCSGVLVNNTNQENRGLLITAQHCITDQNDADKTIFVFNYESPWCSGPDGRVSHSLSGSVLRSTNSTVDFSIVELNTFPPYIYKPYLAGWDVTGNTPASSAAIHHPMGDVKKISIDNDAPVSSTFNAMPTNSEWKILQWDVGTTEGGSSGSPLFDQNKKVVGILTGGEAVCGRSVNDYFVKLSTLYNYSNLLYEQVKGWIDPAVSGVKTLTGRNPYAPNVLTSDTLYNVAKSETHSVNVYTAPKNGYSTGFNSDSLIMYAEYFANAQTREISEVWLNIAKSSYVNLADSVRIYIYSDGPVPGTILASQKTFISETKDSFLLKYDFNKTISVSSNFYVGWRLNYGTKASTESRQLAVFHSPDRFLPSKNTAWFNNGTGWKTFLQHPSFPMSVSLDVKVISVTNSKLNRIENLKMFTEDFSVYPIPAGDRLIISSEKSTDNMEIYLYDITGQMVYHRKIGRFLPGEITVNLTFFKSGLYLLHIKTNNSSETHKVLINR